MSLIRSVGLDNKSLTFVGSIGNPRNKNKYLLADRGRFGFLHFYPDILYIINAFSVFASKVENSGIKYISLLGQMCRSFVFGLFFCLPICKPAPLKRAIPKRRGPFQVINT